MVNGDATLNTRLAGALFGLVSLHMLGRGLLRRGAGGFTQRHHPGALFSPWLIGMGLLSDSDAMGARMMMGLMAVPGEEPDTLNSKIEFTEDGQILANGQRIK